MTATTQLYNPPDIQEASETWNATCGPVALAAVLGVPVMQIETGCFFPNYRGYVNPTQMERALGISGVNWARSKTNGLEYGKYGLCWLQVEGPWLDKGVNPKAAYRYTHWIGLSYRSKFSPEDIFVFDINAGEWLPIKRWEDEVMNPILESVKRATGWHSRKGYEVYLDE